MSELVLGSGQKFSSANFLRLRRLVEIDSYPVGFEGFCCSKYTLIRKR